MLTESILKIISYCVTGTFIGIGYHITNNDKLYMNTSTDISVPYTHLHNDKQIIVFLQHVEKTLRSVDLVSYVRIVSNIDELVGLKNTIQNEGGTLCDRTIAYRIIQKCKESMKRCILIMETSHTNQVQQNINDETMYIPSHHNIENMKFSPREIIRIQSVCKKIVYILDSYLKAIISLTCDGRITC
jgi:hypothetical protein